jgi:hypothetical protein
MGMIMTTGIAGTIGTGTTIMIMDTMTEYYQYRK